MLFMDAFKSFLKEFPGFQPSVFEQIYPLLSYRELEVGDFFLQRGSVCRQIAFVDEGLFRHFYLNDGKEMTNCFCRENTITTAYTSLITQKESDVAIQAIEPSKLIILSYDGLQSLYKRDPFWQQLGRMAAEQEFLVTKSHHRFLIELSATERYQYILKKDPELLQRVPLNHLATYLQVAPETLSRIRKKLTRT